MLVLTTSLSSCSPLSGLILSPDSPRWPMPCSAELPRAIAGHRIRGEPDGGATSPLARSPTQDLPRHPAHRFRDLDDLAGLLLEHRVLLPAVVFDVGRGDRSHRVLRCRHRQGGGAAARWMGSRS